MPPTPESTATSSARPPASRARCGGYHARFSRASRDGFLPPGGGDALFTSKTLISHVKNAPPTRRLRHKPLKLQRQSGATGFNRRHLRIENPPFSRAGLHPRRAKIPPRHIANAAYNARMSELTDLDPLARAKALLAKLIAFPTVSDRSNLALDRLRRRISARPRPGAAHRAEPGRRQSGAARHRRAARSTAASCFPAIPTSFRSRASPGPAIHSLCARPTENSTGAAPAT